MQLTQLIYTSRISDSFSADDIQNIIASAKKNNANSGLTGLLYFNRHYFFQCIEGGRTEVNQLYNKIIKDTRHKDITILFYQTIVKREFSSWLMGYLPASEATQSAYIHYSNNAVFNPYIMSGESAHGLILELRRILQTKPAPAAVNTPSQNTTAANTVKPATPSSNTTITKPT